jgi:hypothetical protein
MAMFIIPLLIFLLGATPAQGLAGSPNLAREAQASASESYQSLTPEKANDGNPATRWSGIPGRNSGVWFELGWKNPVRIAEVIIYQADAYVMELDIQAWDAAKNDWRAVRHLGKLGTKLPRVIIVSFPVEETERLRIADITNGPTFSEVEVYAEPQPRRLSVQAASDLNGKILGIVTDQWGENLRSLSDYGRGKLPALRGSGNWATAIGPRGTA